MPTTQGNYDPKKVIVAFGKVPIIGFADGDDVIRAERNIDEYQLIVGMAGDSVAIHSPNESGVVTVKLLQTSPSNAVLAGQLALQRATNRNFSLVIKDTSNAGQLVSGKFGIIAGPPPQVYGQSHQAREWKIAVADLAMV